MQLNTDFLGSSSDATAEVPAATSDSVNTSVEVPAADPATTTNTGVSTEAVSSPAELVTPTNQEPAPAEVTQNDAPDDEEAELKKFAEDPKTPKFARDKIAQAMAYAGKIKETKTALEMQLEEVRKTYEGQTPLPQTDIERLRQAEERQYKLASFTATPEEVLTNLKEIVAPQKLVAIKNQLAWDFLETPDGQPDLENLQVVIDRFAGIKEGEAGVAAKDVLKAITALKRGTIKPHELHEFSSDAEFEAYQKAQGYEKEIETQKSLARANAEFQETQVRQTVISGAVGQVQQTFQPKVEALFEKFHLVPKPNEPKVATEFKQYVRDRVAAVVNEASVKSASLQDVFTALQLLSKPNGSPAEAIQREIQGYTSSFAYQTALSKGLEDLMGEVEKTVASEAYRYKLMMMGYEQEVSKGQNAREIIGQPNQTQVLTEYTQEQLASMSSKERTHAILQNASNRLREGKPSRLGG